LSGLGTKLTRVLTTDSTSTTSSMSSMSSTGLSQTRDRPAYTSSGRGGAGNIRPISKLPNDSLPSTAEQVEDDTSVPRGREVAVSLKALSSGRGGAGNFRAHASTNYPSAGGSASHLPISRPSGGPDAYELEVLAMRIAEAKYQIRSSGRGGAGNMVSHSRSRSHSRGRPPPTHEVLVSQPLSAPLRRVPRQVAYRGRGGAGNVVSLPSNRN